jgi:hypothetical protein
VHAPTLLISAGESDERNFNLPGASGDLGDEDGSMSRQ